MITKKNKFLELLNKANINDFFGVPDSLLKNLISDIDCDKRFNNNVTSNEGCALAMGVGYHLATRKIPIIYLQNSGMGNIINPLTSIADKNLYSIPMLIIIGWRGEMNKGKQIHDEPQHTKMGQISDKLISSLGYKVQIVSKYEDLLDFTKKFLNKKNQKEPVFILVKKGIFPKITNYKNTLDKKLVLKRYEVLNKILDNYDKKNFLVTTTGFISREVFTLKENKKLKHNNIFYNVGGMGHCLSIAVGIAKFSKKKILCIDGDGSSLMHLGGVAQLEKNMNIIYIIINNRAHESVGGQKTSNTNFNFTGLSELGIFKEVFRVKNEQELSSIVKKITKLKGPILIEILVKKGTIENLGRPDISFKKQVNELQKYLN